MVRLDLPFAQVNDVTQDSPTRLADAGQGLQRSLHGGWAGRGRIIKQGGAGQAGQRAQTPRQWLAGRQCSPHQGERLPVEKRNAERGQQQGQLMGAQ